MKIDFDILWIDDEKDFIDDLKEDLSTFCTNKALNLHLVSKRSGKTLNEAEAVNKYDLIMVDYNLPKNEVGSDFIQRLRNYSLCPDIIFYSSLDLDEITRKEENGRDRLISLLKLGVYYCTADDLLENSKKVITKVIRRDQKPNGFRGLVLSMVSGFENTVNQALPLMVNYCDLNQVSKYINKILDDQVKKTDLCLKAFCSKPLDERIFSIIEAKNYAFDHSKRVRLLFHFTNKITKNQLSFEAYDKQVIQLRNALGHVGQKPENTDVWTIFDGNEEQVLTEEYCKKQREILLQWEKCFKTVLSDLEGKK